MKIFFVAFLFILPILSFSQDLQNGLVGYWPFEGNVNDVSGNGNDGEVNGATSAPDKEGNLNNAFSFNGSTDYINIDNVLDDLTTSSEGTISFWVMPTALGGRQRLFTFGASNSLNMITCFSDNIGKLNIVLGASNVKWRKSTASSVLTDNVWTHVTIVQAGDVPVMYINGGVTSQVNHNQRDNTAWFNTTSGLDNAKIGVANFNNYGDIQFFNGSIDEVGVWNRGLTDVEVQELYNNGISGSAPQPPISNICELIYCDESNIGIGTILPDELLSVSGTIHAKEIRVDLSVPGPDFVFDDDYDLRPLSKLQEYIELNKHLPLIPSADEMENGGIKLGDMNMLLLQKVEEITLYMIDHEKRINTLDQNSKIIKGESK